MIASRLRASFLCTAFAIAATPAMATHIIEAYTTPSGATQYFYAPHATDDAYVAPRSVYYNEPSVTYYNSKEPSVTYYNSPSVSYYDEPRVSYAPPVTVVAPRRTNDQFITDDVVDVLRHDPRLTGKIGVETHRNSVRLTGVVTTPGQARIAAHDAQSVDGVREVRNELRTKVGGSP